MNPETVKKLNQLNNDFYEAIGQYFNQSRGHSWDGWAKLGTILKQSWNEKKSLKVLELGCGNGRFLEFLLKNNFKVEKYIGLDYSDFLLDKAESRLSGLDFDEAEFIKCDLLFDDWVSLLRQKGVEEFDLICLFGVMHHIPGKNYRQKLMQKAADLMSTGGLFVFTTWQYLDVPRLSRRVIDKQSARVAELEQKYDFDLSEFEENDNILDWHRGNIAYRFSHYYTKSEIDYYAEQIGLKIKETFEADGKEGNVNRYFVLGKN